MLSNILLTITDVFIDWRRVHVNWGQVVVTDHVQKNYRLERVLAYTNVDLVSRSLKRTALIAYISTVTVK